MQCMVVLQGLPVYRVHCSQLEAMIVQKFLFGDKEVWRIILYVTAQLILQLLFNRLYILSRPKLVVDLLLFDALPKLVTTLLVRLSHNLPPDQRTTVFKKFLIL